MNPMAGVEFLPDSGDRAGAPDPRAATRHRAAGVLALVGLAAIAAVVVHRGGGREQAIPSPTVAPHPVIGAFPVPHFAAPASIAFGPASLDVLGGAGRVYSLTPTLIALTGRFGGATVVRGAPFGLSQLSGRPELVLDPGGGFVWAVAIGATAIGGYDARTLTPRLQTASPYPINAAVAMDGRLWFTTAHGLYTAQPGWGRPRLMARSHAPLGPVTVDRTLHQVIAADEGDPVRLHSYSALGPLSTLRVPLTTVTSLAFPTGALWLSGTTPVGPRLVVLYPPSMRVLRTLPVPGGLGHTASIVGTWQNRVLVRVAASDGPLLLCIDAYEGTFKQSWHLPPGGTSLDADGLLVETGHGIAQRDARSCLSP